MTTDSINEEIRSIRHVLAAQCGNDVGRILAEARQREATDGHTYISLAPRRPVADADEHGNAPLPRVASVAPSLAAERSQSSSEH